LCCSGIFSRERERERERECDRGERGERGGEREKERGNFHVLFATHLVV